MTLNVLNSALSSIGGGYAVDKWLNPERITIVALGQDASYYPNPETELIEFSTADEAILVVKGKYVDGVFTDAYGHTLDSQYVVSCVIGLNDVMSLVSSVWLGPTCAFVPK
jgi:hypothetical protein